MKTVYVLGAGASKHVGYPLASTMGAEMLAWMSTRDGYRETAEAIKETFGDSPNIEDVITDLDDIITSLEGAKELADRERRTIAAHQRSKLAEVLPQWFLETHTNPASAYERFAKNIVQPGDVIITFNYDDSLERELKRVSAVTRVHIGAYLASLQSHKGYLSNATVQQRLTVLRLFYAYLVEEGACPKNPTAYDGARALVPRHRKLPWVPNEDDWQTILAAAAQEPIRNRVMFTFAYDAGLRREELCSLCTNDIDPSRRTIWVRAENTKGRRDRVVPYSAASGALLAGYLDHRRTFAQKRGPLFLSESRRNYSDPISIWSWSKIVLRVARRAEVPRFTTHTLHHLCLTDLARAGWDIHEIATFAGHRSVQTTLLYIHLSGRDLARKLAAGMAQIHAQRTRMLAETTA